MLFLISSIQVQTADGVVQEAGGYTSDQILQALDVHPEENIFSFDPGSKAAALEKVSPCWRISGWSGITPEPWWCG
jgi:hypothetical protein